ncbi:hypothetical protein FLK61_34630 [Paenalkalicoccus suaedae]|uniref:DUF5673 domain-containing protein n=1 Tax=Paenalkalicoccus suaedae TaxID=2592382 RepID=A0A859FF60_9BACI|nr:hypothetical protein [Paenalkalicoccus suaedae]QKS71809.1 hypothetical protein FLK61_34630 [Paenalkalicoccus suaedae]
MEWLYLFTAAVMGAISLYHLFTHRHRKNQNDMIIYTPQDKKKLSTTSSTYKASVIAAWAVIILSFVLVIEVFISFTIASALFFTVLALGAFVLMTLDRIFQVQGDALIFAGYYAKWGRIQFLEWGKKRGNRRQLIMTLAKGQRIKTTVDEKHKAEIEDLLKDYVSFQATKHT